MRHGRAFGFVTAAVAAAALVAGTLVPAAARAEGRPADAASSGGIRPRRAASPVRVTGYHVPPGFEVRPDDGFVPGPRPLLLPGGGRITLRAAPAWRRIGADLVDVLADAHDEYADLLGPLGPVSTTVKLMESEEFYETTKTPRWTNAMFYRGEIVIPIDARENADFDNLVRSVRHEYVHSVLHTVGGGRCPGWLDEGLAQWAEGHENPALAPALHKWVSRNGPVPLSLLRGGFTKLDPPMVPAAYAQSLAAARVLMERHGFGNIRRYLDVLAAGAPRDEAFREAFGTGEREFERRLAVELVGGY